MWYRSIIIAVSLLTFSAACSLAETSKPDSGSSLIGAASVIDGDTVEISGQRVRLSGVDFPERGSRCGSVNVYQAAALALSDFIGTRNVTCALTGDQSGERAIGTCTAGGTDLARFMTESGWARDWPRYSGGVYAQAESSARKAGAGIWGLACPDDLWGTRNYD